MTRERVVAIIGGGFSGALTAYHLTREDKGCRVVVVDPGERIGLGLAYSTPSGAHLLNVPAAKISALPQEPDHFLNWLRRNHDAKFDGADFAPRRTFGRYVRSLVEGAGEIEHLQTTAVNCRMADGRAVVEMEDGSSLEADAVVLATGNFDPAALPGVSEEARQTGIYRHSAWQDGTYEGFDEDAPVALIGTGLTAIDVLLRLRESGHRGTVTAISRHGVFPNRHAAYEPLQECALGAAPRSARELLRGVHEAIREGKDWRAVVDSVRPRTNELWMALPVEEQKRFRRHLLRRWEVVRHRMAPRIADRLEAEMAAGTLVSHRGSLEAVTVSEGGGTVRFRTSGGSREITAKRVINCTGPSLNYRKAGSRLLHCLFEQGLIVEGPLGYGLWSDACGALRGGNGSFSKVLYAVGPARMGTLIESIAVPELREQAAGMAMLLAERRLQGAA